MKKRTKEKQQHLLIFFRFSFILAIDLSEREKEKRNCIKTTTTTEITIIKKQQQQQKAQRRKKKNFFFSKNKKKRETNIFFKHNKIDNDLRIRPTKRLG